jgi:GTPase
MHLASSPEDATSISSLVPTEGYTKITRLEAEPQEGPTEYKLHLLLRRRRSFTRVSTGHRVPGSLRRSDTPASVSVGRSVSESDILSSTPPPLASTHSKQHRLEQLTTQLLWRLQQSCSYHISSTTAAVLPHLPDDAQLSSPELPQRLLPGLEESKGALYEIGVADNGTIVGLAEDEMEESLNNLRAMAASLGCGVEVLRMVSVGECEWVEHSSTSRQKPRTSKLLVAEALVRPLQHLVDHTKTVPEVASDARICHDDKVTPTTVPDRERSVEQLRVSVTGATMSGKSSLIGTLSTATLDNGRGKSRLSLLKHRHEIASGMTSSVTQELIGYREVTDRDGNLSTQVIGYSSGDVSSWIDIHVSIEAAADGRLVILSDSAGHPRFRRTTVRGIVGW